MAETTHSHSGHSHGARFDRAWLLLAALLAAVAVMDAAALWPVVRFTGGALLDTAPFIAFAVLAIGGLKASGAENLVARAFQGREVRMIMLAALVGGLAPFCSCEVIPFIAALLALGAPLSAVMAFWLASPLMDPAMFLITSGTLGLDFALAKTAAAVGLGLMGGFGTWAFAATPVFRDPLRAQNAPRCETSCCGSKTPFSGTPVWRFWNVPARRATFRAAALENAGFLLKWLTLAYAVEAVMIRYVPAEWIADLVGGPGLGPIVLGALLGAPAYLNGYAAVPLVDALLNQGMSNGAAMSFMLAGGVSCIPAAIAVWALVKPRVFAAYLGYAFAGSVIAGLLWQSIA
ncbi:permease [Defluviimonas sp. WL0024]|uniref:Permease n=1 Tax=Albidovulum salinarum TaxID=2984153 RepID=A0ABT2X6G6_9RHOB|nr:permease [Defluviimonas sp. WL0024]MCU9849542.1 permease [Defluviimonas sp. WL0024]